jgi:hypothetical protein
VVCPDERYVDIGDVITASGVSAGIDGRQRTPTIDPRWRARCHKARVQRTFALLLAPADNSERHP